MCVSQLAKARQTRLHGGQRQHAVADRRGNRLHRFDLRSARADGHDHVGAGHQRIHSRLADAIAVRDRVHVHAVGDDHAVVAELLAQHAGEDRMRHGGRIDGVQRRIDDVGRHHGRCVGRSNPERGEFELFEVGARFVDVRQVAVRIDMRVAMAGEVLDAAGHAFALAAFHPGQRNARRLLGIGAERALGNHRVARVVVQVQHRREVPVEAQRAHRARHGCADLARQVRIIGCAERHRAGRGRHPGRTHDGAAFLVKGDQRLRPDRITQRAREAGQLRRVAHVLAEQAGAANAVGTQEGVGLGIEFGAEQAHHHQLAGQVEVVVHGRDSGG